MHSPPLCPPSLATFAPAHGRIPWNDTFVLISSLSNPVEVVHTCASGWALTVNAVKACDGTRKRNRISSTQFHMMIILLQMSGERKAEKPGMSRFVAAQAAVDVLKEVELAAPFIEKRFQRQAERPIGGIVSVGA